MIAVDHILVSPELFDKKFVCDLGACKGECCVEGVSGAPLEKEEVAIMEEVLDKVKPFMTEKGIQSVHQNGVYVIDEDRELTTPLVDGGECAFVYRENGIVKCAFEKAYLKGETQFKKPISCHLYPIRVTFQKGIEKLEYHKWKICKPACKNGESLNVQVYKFLREPLERKYGPLWFNKLRIIDEQRALQTSAKKAKKP